MTLVEFLQSLSKQRSVGIMPCFNNCVDPARASYVIDSFFQQMEECQLNQNETDDNLLLLLQITISSDFSAWVFINHVLYSWLLKSRKHAVHNFIIDLYSYLALEIPDMFTFHINELIPFLLESTDSKLAHKNLGNLSLSIRKSLSLRNITFFESDQRLLKLKINSSSKEALISSLRNISSLISAQKLWKFMPDAFCFVILQDLIVLWKLQCDYLGYIENLNDSVNELTSVSLLLNPLLSLCVLLNSPSHEKSSAIIKTWLSEEGQSLLVFFLSVQSAYKYCSQHDSDQLLQLMETVDCLIRLFNECFELMDTKTILKILHAITKWISLPNPEIFPWTQVLGILRAHCTTIPDVHKYYSEIFNYCCSLPWPIGNLTLETLEVVLRNRQVTLELSSEIKQFMAKYLRGFRNNSSMPSKEDEVFMTKLEKRVERLEVPTREEILDSLDILSRSATGLSADKSDALLKFLDAFRSYYSGI